jgi:tetratricopeptide (TPR) repeat protein
MDTIREKGKELMEHIWLARLNFMEGKLDSALEHIKTAEAINPRDNETKALKGLYYVQVEKYPEALELLESVADSEPGFSFNYVNLSTAYREVDRIAEAIEAGKKAVQLNPKDPAAHFTFSQALALDGKILDSIHEVLQTLKLNPSHLMAYVFLGTLYRHAGQTDAVIELYTECLRHVPEADPIREELVELLNTHGLTLIHTGRPSDGEPYLREAIRLMPNRLEPVLNLALGYAAQQRWTEAKEHAHFVIIGSQSGSILHGEAERLLVAIKKEEESHSKQ